MQTSDYDAIGVRFGSVVDAVTDWDAPTPVPEWRARDIVHHLTTWLPGLLDSCGIDAPVGDLADPVGSWHAQDAAIRTLLADRAGEPVTHESLGTKPLGQLLAEVYFDDVFMHTWDLARSAALDDTIDQADCREILARIEPIEDLIRDSGHFGSRWAGDPGPDPQRRLLAFIGRDPDWRP